MANSVVINILAKVKGLNEVESMKAKLTGLTTSKGFQNAVMGVGISAGMAAWNAVGSAVRGAVGSLEEMARAAMEEEAQIARLTTTLVANSQGWDGNIAAVEEVIDGRKRLAFADDEMRESLIRLVPVTGDLNSALELQKTAMDVARLRNISLEDASDKLGKALVGNKRVLKELGIELDSAATDTEILAEVQRVAAGQAEEYALTHEAAAKRVGNAWQDLKEDAGAQVLAWADDFATGLGALDYWWKTGANDLDDYAEHLLRVKAVAEGDVPTLVALGDSVSEINAAARAAQGPVIKVTDAFKETEDAALDMADALDVARKAWDLLNNRIDTSNEFENLPDRIIVAADEVKTAQAELNAAIAAGNKAAIAAARIRLRDAGNELDKLRRRFAQLRLEIGQVIRVGSVGTGVGSGYQHRAGGGPVTRGEAYVVGESGAELFVPRTSGRIVSHDDSLAAGRAVGGVTLVYSPTFSTASAAEARQFATVILPELTREMRRQSIL